MNDDQRLLASAVLDDAVTSEERTRAEADPEVRAEIERLRAVRDQLQVDVDAGRRPGVRLRSPPPSPRSTPAATV